jgi:hypothetical protein
MNTKFVEKSIADLKSQDLFYDAEVMQQLLNEHNRLLRIFQKLDNMYQPHTPETFFGLLDSPDSLISHTKEAIQAALKKED